ncbi:MAG: acyl-CoA synthetase, partial [Acidimicrobiia bacterium]|nr:acyl-CoA synthetase [Acidimicrobiia bacterium]
MSTGAVSDQFVSIPATVQEAVKRWTTREAVIDGDVRLTFDDVGNEMMRVARSLLSLGIEPGDRVVLWAPNSAVWIPTALGILATGAWLVPMNTRFRGEEAGYILNKTKARVLFAPTDFLGSNYFDLLTEVDGGLPSLEHRVGIPAPGSMT